MKIAKDARERMGLGPLSASAWINMVVDDNTEKAW